MASFVVNGLMCCAHPLSARQILLLYVTVAWTYGLLDTTTMTTDTLYFLTAAQYRGW